MGVSVFPTCELATKFIVLLGCEGTGNQYGRVIKEIRLSIAGIDLAVKRGEKLLEKKAVRLSALEL
jgi:hypothetical protein